jgi:hypothetical protein
MPRPSRKGGTVDDVLKELKQLRNEVAAYRHELERLAEIVSDEDAEIIRELLDNSEKKDKKGVKPRE